MLQLLETQKGYVREDLEQYQCAMVVTFDANGESTLGFPRFEDESERRLVYEAVVDDAKRRGAVAIVTVNHAFSRNGAQGHDEPWGLWNSGSAQPCILLTASGPLVGTKSLTLRYRIVDGEVIFDAQPEWLDGVELNLLPGWPDGPASVVQ